MSAKGGPVFTSILSVGASCLPALSSVTPLCGISSRNEEVGTNVCRINIDSSSANATLYSSRKTPMFWKVFG